MVFKKLREGWNIDPKAYMVIRFLFIFVFVLFVCLFVAPTGIYGANILRSFLWDLKKFWEISY
jgi:hypothetical protein